MEKDNIDEQIIRQWLDGELSKEKIEELGRYDVYKDYKRIIDATNNLSVIEYNDDELFSKIKKENNPKEKPVKRLKFWLYSAAASILVLLGYMYFYGQSQEYKTGYGEQLLVVLPDNSKVKLNANSSLQFKERLWEENRVVKFNGEGFFEVEKGRSFRVETSEGVVEVLGTKFNVIVQPNLFEVTCQEGKVKTSNLKGKSQILTRGMGIRMISDGLQSIDFNGEEPTWLKGESSFNDTPLKQVITALQNQFGITITSKSVDQSQLFTGSFTHSNLNIALKTVFDAMEISYTFENDKEVVLFKANEI